jgi:uncharacterized membrane protein YccC
MPGMFAIGEKAIGSPTVATFAAFGSFAMLLLVDFGGPMRDRLRNQATLALAAGVLVSVATLASRSTGLAAGAMAIVAFGVLFAGVTSSVLAAVTTSLLLAFILPVTLAAPASAIPDRLAGWGLASGASLIAIALLWPAPGRDPLRSAAIAASRALAARLRADVHYVLGGDGGSAVAIHETEVAAANAAVEQLHQVFFATPYRPTGLSTAARMLVRLVDELRWLSTIIVESTPHPGATALNPAVCAVRMAVASVLDRGADMLDAPDADPAALHDAVDGLHQALAELEDRATAQLPSSGDAVVGSSALAVEERIDAFISSLDPTFRAQELSFVASQLARNVDLAAAAARRGWVQRLLGRQPEGLAGALSAAQERAGAHVARNSVWLRNSVRGAVALGLAVLVAKLTGVQHAFWVVFGTLSVLRSNALSTGQNVLRGLLGTTIGFAVGAALVAIIGTNTTLLWVLLPVAVLLAGVAPAVISFAAGQAGFTLTLLILFNILAPAGWRIGLVRIEDVALGSAVSLAVGMLFWPRGAAAALGTALASAYTASARYLASTVDFGMGRCDANLPSRDAPIEEAIQAAAASRRLDDTFRGYLAERGAKSVPLAEVTGLVTGVAGLRLAGDAVLDLWQRNDGVGGDRAAARNELLARSERVVDWYTRFAAGLSGPGELPEPLARDPPADQRLIDAISHDLRSADGRATDAAARMIWTGDHLDAARRLQGVLAEPAQTAVSGGALVPHPESNSTRSRVWSRVQL